MRVTENKSVHSTVSFNYWATRAGLIPEEAFLIEQYLKKEVATLEAGTAGGRILFEMQARGYRPLHGFDHIPGLIEAAKARDSASEITFSVQDATILSYRDESFDQLVYLQQIICMIEREDSRRQAILESYRILKKGGTALFSFLSFEARNRSPIYKCYLEYLRILRALSRGSAPIQYLPWLKLGGRFNWRCLIDSSPYVYWYRAEEAVAVLKQVGFTVGAIGTGYQISRGKMLRSIDELKSGEISGMLYVVVRK